MKLKQGHTLVRLFDMDKKRTVYLHCLVLELFIGPCPKGKQCCHEDDNGFNNRLKNLRWDTHKANFADALRNGRVSKEYHRNMKKGWPLCKGEVNGRAKLTAKNVRFIRAAYQSGQTLRQLADLFRMSVEGIRFIVCRRTWRHVI